MRKAYSGKSIITGSIPGWFNLHVILALAGMAGPLLLLSGDFVLLQSVVNYSPVRSSISSLAWTGMGWVQNFSFITTGFFLEGFAAVLLLSIQRARGFTAGIILLACSGFSLLLVGAFRMDIPYYPSTMDGTIHGIAAYTVFLLLPLASLLIAPSLKKDPRWRPLYIYSLSTAAFGLYWMAICSVSLPQELGRFGLFERVLALNELVWVEVMAIWLLRLFRQRTSLKYQPDLNVSSKSEFQTLQLIPNLVITPGDTNNAASQYAHSETVVPPATAGPSGEERVPYSEGPAPVH